MKQDTEKTEVLFLLENIDKDKKTVFAYFPHEKYNDTPFLMTCYAHIGQHSSCSMSYASKCKKAKKEQYKDLQTELESIGYNLLILNKN